MGVTTVIGGASFAHPHPRYGLSMAAPATGLQVLMGRGAEKGPEEDFGASSPAWVSSWVRSGEEFGDGGG